MENLEKNIAHSVYNSANEKIENSNIVPVKKNKISTRETLCLTREKITKSARENFLIPVKILKKVPVKNTFYPWKNPKKPKNCVFTGTFGFHG